MTDERIAALERRVAELERVLWRRDHDARLGGVLYAVHAFAHETTWTVGELLDDARRAAPGLWTLLDQLVGARGDPRIRLGRWLQRHEGIEADGLRLVRVKRAAGSWLYAVQRVELGELSAQLPSRAKAA